MGATPWVGVTLALFRERATFGCPVLVAPIGAMGTIASATDQKTLNAYARAHVHRLDNTGRGAGLVLRYRTCRIVRETAV